MTTHSNRCKTANVPSCFGTTATPSVQTDARSLMTDPSTARPLMVRSLMAGSLMDGAIDALDSQIAVLDHRGVIIRVNESWRRALDENESDELGVGCNYLHTCESHASASDEHANESRAAADGIRRVIEGELNEFTVEFPIGRPMQRRWIRMRAAPFSEGDARYVVVSHEDITHRREAERAEIVGTDVAQRKQAEQALRASEERYRMLVEGHSEMLCRFRVDGTIVFANSAYAKAFDASPDELIGRSFWDIIDEADHAQVRQQLEKLSPEEPEISIENRIETADGTRWTLWINRGLVFDEAGRVIEAQSLGRDITDRKQAEQAQALLAAIVSSSDDAIISKTLEGRITSWNRGAERLFGYSAEEAIGQSITIVIPEERMQEESRILADLRRGDRVIQFETVRQTKDGRLIDISLTVSPVRDAQGRIIGASKVARNITAQKISERALRESEQRLRAIIDTAVDGVITIDERGIVESVNPAAVTIFGYQPEEVIGRNVSMLMPEPEHTEYDSRLANDRRTGERRILDLGREVRGRRKDGSTFPMELAVSETKLHGDRRIFTGLVRDITDRKRHEEKMKLVMQELNHRVKNTLAVVASTADQTMRHTSTLDEFKAAFSERLQAMSKAHRLLTRTEWEGAELRDLLHAEFEHRVERDEQVRLDGPLVLLEPNAALAMHMMLHELSTNAVKYGSLSAPDGRVDVDWWTEPNVDGSRFIVIRWVESGGPTVEPATRRGFGTRILDQTVRYELDGDADVRYELTGVVCTIRVPESAGIRVSEGG